MYLRKCTSFQHSLLHYYICAIAVSVTQFAFLFIINVDQDGGKKSEIPPFYGLQTSIRFRKIQFWQFLDQELSLQYKADGVQKLAIINL